MKKAHFLNDGYLDSFSIVQFVLEVELLIKKKINMKNIKRDNFSNVDNILKFINKQ
jgi:acyl carrier protein